MSQHDGVIDNQAGGAFRADLNNFLLAALSNSSGATAPSATYAYQFWADTTTGLMKQRNAANTAWITLGTLASTYWGLLAAANGVATGTLDISEALKFSGDISPAQITADQNDYAPAGFSTTLVLRLSTDAARSITGLAGGSDGRYVSLHNVGSRNLKLKNESASSTAANRFALLADTVILPNHSVNLWYDSTSSRWRVASGGHAVGQIVQVVQTVKSDSFTTTSTSFTDITGLSVAITLKSQDNDVLVPFMVSGSQDIGVNRTTLRLMRDSTAICVGDAAGSRIQGTGGFSSSADSIPSAPVSGVYKDTPASAAAITYKLQIILAAGAGTCFINRTDLDTDEVGQLRMASTITAMEIVA